MSNKNKIHEMMKDWALETNREGLFSKELIDDYISYIKKSHAQIVYMKCLRNKKYKLAEKIKDKYIIADVNSDRVISIGMALICKNKLKHKESKIYISGIDPYDENDTVSKGSLSN